MTIETTKKAFGSKNAIRDELTRNLVFVAFFACMGSVSRVSRDRSLGQPELIGFEPPLPVHLRVRQRLVGRCVRASSLYRGLWR